jgi:hypothetical protein
MKNNRRQEHMLQRYFSRIENPYIYPSILIALIGILCFIYSDTIGLYITTLINKTINLLRLELSSNFDQLIIKTINYSGLFFIVYGILRISEIKFPRIINGSIWLLTGVIITFYSSTLSKKSGEIIEIINRKNLLQFDAAMYNYFNLILNGSGPLLILIGILILSISFYRFIPSDKTVDKLFNDRLEKIWNSSLEKLNLKESDLITPKGKRFNIVTMSRFLLDEVPEMVPEKKGIIRRYIKIISDTISYWRSTLYIENEDFEYNPQDWGMHLGFDNKWRFSCHIIFFVHLTSNFVAFYKCEYNFIRNKIMAEMTARHFYEDVVGVEKNDFIANKKLIRNAVTTKDQELKILLRGSENIMIYAPLTIVYKRRGFDKLIKGPKKRKRLISEMDIMEKNIHAYVVDRKHPMEDNPET